MEASALEGAVRFVSLSAPSAHWAEQVLEALDRGLSRNMGAEAIESFRRRGLSIAANARRLKRLYGELP